MSEHHPAESDGSGAPEAASTLFQRAERVFFEVAPLSPGDRDAAVARLCGSDSVLRAEVQALLGAAGRLGAFLEKPALGVDAERLARESREQDELIGAVLGAYRVEGRIASGGMGTVYRGARCDGQFEQSVAIKVVKRGMDSEEILRRFHAERRTLAALDHPNIARLIDGGMTPDGRPFLVMEFVDGVPIDTFCDAGRLKVRERIELFRTVSEGVHHAHQNLVIHRDLKPSNILVTPQGVPKLLDFGIAKVLSGGGTGEPVTAETDRRLTPEYASPEQVEGGAVTTATDVYALGVILYELLTGTRPYHFGARTTEEVRRIVCSVIPPAPSAAVTVRATRVRDSSRLAAGTQVKDAAGAPGPDVPRTRGVTSTRLRGLLRGDLDTIVLMALRKEPRRRYASAEQFGADLGRFLDGMPVRARKDTLAYRASKFVRRHAWSVSLTGAAALLLAASTVVLYRQGRDLARQRDELVAANRRLDETRRYLSAVIGGADVGSRGPDARLGDVLRDAVDALAVSPPDDPLTRASAEQAIGGAVMSLGMLREARPLLERASRGFATLPAESDARIDAEVDLAELSFFEGRHAEAETALRALLDAERARASGAHTRREGRLLTDLGAALRAQGRADESIAVQREAIESRAVVFGPSSLPVAESRNNLASSLFQKGDVEPAAAEFRQSLAARRALLRPDHPLVVRCEANLGLVLSRSGSVDEAVQLLTGAAERWDGAFGPEHPGRVATITSLAEALRRQGRNQDALAWLDRALAWQREHQPGNAAGLAATEANLGITHAALGPDARAEELLSRALPALRSGGRGVAGVLKQATESLAAIYERSGRAEEAKALRESINASAK